MIKITIFNEFIQEQRKPEVAAIYPEGIHGAIAQGIKQDGLHIQFATFDEPEHGLTQEKLEDTDVLIYWGHVDHKGFQDAVIDRICERIHKGMGLIVLHSGHHSKLFRRLMGTSCDLLWREADEKERLWVVDPSHPIVEGIGPYIDLPEEEMYGEHFDIPVPDELIFVSWFAGGEVFRSGCTYRRGQGRIFYFRPGHETYPTYHNKEIHRVISNAVKWTAPVQRETTYYGHHTPLEEINK